MNNEGLVWEEPPPPRNPRKRTAESTERILAQLKANPGKWALVMTVDYSGGHNQWYSHGVEIARRKNSDNKFDVYMRWPAPEADASGQADN